MGSKTHQPTVLILSEEQDASTDHVMEWLKFFDAKVIRMNGEKLWKDISSIALSNKGDGPSLKLENGEFFPIKNLTSIWFRRLVMPEYHCDHPDKLVRSHLHREYRASQLAFLNIWDGIHSLGRKRMGEDKFEVLMKAKEVNLDIPSTLLTTQKSELSSFLEKEGKLICKCASDPEFFKVDDTRYMLYTEEVTTEVVSKLTEVFAPSLFQEKLDKSYELRIFYLDGHCYPMAIFSQTRDDSKIDFRVGQTDINMRRVPHKLPEDLIEKLKALMLKINYNTGSIDIVHTLDGRDVFLEVNPVGQFGMTSGPCHYNLEEKVARYLLKMPLEEDS